MSILTSNKDFSTTLLAFNQHWLFVKELGEGMSANVYLVQNIYQPEQKMALKIFKSDYIAKSDNCGLQSIQNEMVIMSQLDHPHIVKMIACGDNGTITNLQTQEIIQNQTYIAMEHFDGQDLFDFQDQVSQRGEGLGEEAGRFILGQLIAALEYCHSNGIVHQDIKLENVLIDHHMHVKLFDFGFAKYENIDKLTQSEGTPAYMSPQILEGVAYNGISADIFALGVVLVGIVKGVQPFEYAILSDRYYSRLASTSPDVQKEYWRKMRCDHFSQELKDLASSMLSYNEESRPTDVKQIWNHPYMNGFQMDTERVRKIQWTLIAQYQQKLQLNEDVQTDHSSSECSSSGQEAAELSIPEEFEQ